MFAPDSLQQADATAQQRIAEELAGALGETEELPRRQIRRVVQTLGAERARAFLAEALAVEARGGLLVPDGSRRRTPGGVFFHLVRAQAGKDEYRAIFRPHGRRGRGNGARGTADTPAFTWDDYAALGADLRRGLGEATTVKITVIGRPGQVSARGDAVIVGLRSERAPSLPKGLPAPPRPQTAYAVFIARKQWQQVAAALQQPDDRLIVEGFPTLDPRFDGITVLATQVTTKSLQAAKRQQQARG